MNLSTPIDIHIDVRYKHHWINHPLTICTKIDTRTIDVDVSGKNDNLIYKKIRLEDGKHQLLFSCDNKTNMHTITDQSGKTINDSYMQLIHVKINDIDVTELVKSDAYFIKENGDKIVPNDGIWLNGTLCFDFVTPRYDWFLECVF